jgi:enterochelin esterase-like enzyme
MTGTVVVKKLSLDSQCLNRKVLVDIYQPSGITQLDNQEFLLINDGQDLVTMDFAGILESLLEKKEIRPLICIGIHAGPDRKMEYGVAGVPDFKGRGAMAMDHSAFVLTELLPFLRAYFSVTKLPLLSYAGFSLGALMALDTVWIHPRFFKMAAVFSGSLWWRSLDQTDPDYNDDLHRIMHQRIRSGSFHPGLKFFFQCGNKDETNDRNKNGIIDSIEDTRDLIQELVDKGYAVHEDIAYLEMEDGSHDVPTWARAFPDFLKWAFEKVEG